jgi:hypothetical protein
VIKQLRLTTLKSVSNALPDPSLTLMDINVDQSAEKTKFKWNQMTHIMAKVFTTVDHTTQMQILSLSM